MSNRKIIAERTFPLGFILWGFVGAAVLAAGLVQGNWHFTLAAVPELALAAALLAFRPAAFEGEITETGLRVGGIGVEVPYASIQSVTLNGIAQDPDAPKLKAGPIVIMHREGSLEIPARTDMPVKDLYRCLIDRTEGSGDRRVGDLLMQYLTREEHMFGADRVLTFRAREQLGRRPSTRREQACCLALALSGIFWIAASLYLWRGPRQDPMPWPPLGILLALVGALAWLVSLLAGRHMDANFRGWRNACLVLSPTGLALVQGETQGQMRWDELHEATLSNRRPFITAAAGENLPGGLQLVVAGARIRVADVYDRPLPAIARSIRRYWQGGPR
jgi:hypothetical protein